jgi:hypothetical protein
MARFVSGEVVVVPFPFTDLSSAKVRPALVLASRSRGDVILCQITSQAAGHSEAIPVLGCRFRARERVAASQLCAATPARHRQRSLRASGRGEVEPGQAPGDSRSRVRDDTTELT